MGGRLRKGEQYDRVLFELLPVGLALCRMDGTLVDVNPAFAAIIGRTVEETLSLTYWEITPVKYADQERFQIESLTRNGRYGPYEKEYIHKSGHLVPVRLQGRLLEMEGEEFIWSSVEDISELRAATEQLRVSEEKFRTIYDRAPVGIFRSTGGGRFLSANPTAAALFGYDSPEEFVSTVTDIPAQIFVHPEQRVAILTDALHSDGFARREVEYRRKDGSCFIANLYMRAVRDGQGGIAFLEGFLEDITERKQLEEKLQRSESLLNEAQSLAQVGGWEYDVRRSTIVWTEEVYRIHDLSPDSYDPNDIGNNLQFYPHHDRQEIERAFRRAVEGGEPYDLELEFVTAGGRRLWVRTVGKPVVQGGETVRVVGNIMDITERKQVEIALKEQARLLLESQRIANIGSWSVDIASGEIHWTEETFRLYGVSPEEGTPDLESSYNLLHPGDRAAMARWIGRCLAGESPGDLEFRVSHPDGNIRTLNGRGNLERDVLNRPIRIVGTVQDITERKLLEAALRERNEQLRLFVEHSPAAVAMLDRDMRYIIASRRWLTDYRLGDQEVTGKSHYELFPEIPERWKEIHRRCLAGAIERSDEDAFVRADGSIDWIRWEVRPWYARTGVIGGIIIFSEDITARKRAEEAVRHERDFSAALIDSLPAVMYLYDQNLQLLRWNKNFERVLGYGAEVSRMSPLDFFAGEDRELIRSRIQEVFAAGASDAEAEFVVKDGTRIPYYFTGLRTEIDGRICLLGVGIDISARRKAEADLSRLTRDLENRVAERTVDLQRSKLALMNVVDDLNIKTAELAAANEKLMEVDRLKSMFIASMSHELRTPLNSVIGYSSVLLNEWLGPVTPVQKEKLAIVLRAGKHLLSLVNDVIDVSKIEAHQVEVYLEDFDLFDLIAEAAEQVESDLWGKGLAFSVENARARLRTDRRRLLQAVLNLLSNAMKYTVEGAVRISARVCGEWAEIRVSDTGIGISNHDAEKIFKPFVRIDSPLKSTVAGTGLGLYLTWKLVAEILNGTISFTSHTGQGSIFTIHVPVDLEAQAQGGEDESSDCR